MTNTQPAKTAHIRHTICIDLDSANQRFDRYLRKYYKPYTHVTLSMIYSWLRTGAIRLNDKKAKEDTKIMLGDTIQINIDKTTPLLGKHQGGTQRADQGAAHAAKQREMIRKNICYEDDNWLAFNKPPHILMHPGSGSSRTAITMNDWLYTYLNIAASKEKTAAGGLDDDGDDSARMITRGSTFKPAFGYRLDKDTSGVLIAAKTYEALQYLNEQIRERNIQKRYVVVVHGKLPAALMIDKPLFKGFHSEMGRAHMFVNYEKGQEAQTLIYSLGDHVDPTLGPISLGLVRLFTGRMHQIRVHLASENYPVVGDKEYGNSALTRIAAGSHTITRQLLHSFSYSVFDPYTHEMRTVQAALPDDMQRLFPHVTVDTILKKIADKKDQYNK